MCVSYTADILTDYKKQSPDIADITYNRKNCIYIYMKKKQPKYGFVLIMKLLQTPVSLLSLPAHPHEFYGSLP